MSPDSGLIGCFSFCGDILVSLNLSSSPYFLISSPPFTINDNEKILPLVTHLAAPLHQKMLYIQKKNAIIILEIFNNLNQLQNQAKNKMTTSATRLQLKLRRRNSTTNALARLNRTCMLSSKKPKTNRKLTRTSKIRPSLGF